MVLDIVFLAVLAYAARKGYKKGVFATLSAVAGYVIALVGTLILFPLVQVFLTRQVHLTEKLSPWVAEKMALPAASFQTKIADVALDKAVEMIKQRDLPDFFKEIMLNYVRDFTQLPVTKGINNLGQGISFTIANFLVNAIGFFLLITCLALFFRIIIPKLFKTVSPKPVRLIDKLGGAALGTCGGLVSIGVLVVVLIPLASMGALKGNPSPLADQMHASLGVRLFTAHMETILSIIFSGRGF